MSNATLEYFEEYRQKIAEADRLYKRERELRREAEQIQQHRQQIKEDLANMGRLITAMIENDWDPVEAKLKTESGERQRSFWDVVNATDIDLNALNLLNSASRMKGANSSGLMTSAGGISGSTSYGCNNYPAPATSISVSGAIGSSYACPIAKGVSGGTGNYP